jgi:hypothetical protein
MNFDVGDRRPQNRSVIKANLTVTRVSSRDIDDASGQIVSSKPDLRDLCE